MPVIKRWICRIAGHCRRYLDLNYGDTFVCLRCGERVRHAR